MKQSRFLFSTEQTVGPVPEPSDGQGSSSGWLMASFSPCQPACRQGYGATRWAGSGGTGSSYFGSFRATFWGKLPRPLQQLMGTGSCVCVLNLACDTETHQTHVHLCHCQQDAAGLTHKRESLSLQRETSRTARRSLQGRRLLDLGKNKTRFHKSRLHQLVYFLRLKLKPV